MRKANGLGQHLVELERPGDRARDLRHLERMRQPGPIQVALVVDEHLGLVDQPAERGGMDDAIAVPLIFRTVGGLRLRVAAAARMLLEGGIGGQGAHPKDSAKTASSAVWA